MTNNYEAALAAAIDRDIVEAERLDQMHKLVTDLLDALLPEAHALAHPDACWHPGDLLDDLKAHADAIARERVRVSAGPVVMEDW